MVGLYGHALQLLMMAGAYRGDCLSCCSCSAVLHAAADMLQDVVDDLKAHVVVLGGSGSSGYGYAALFHVSHQHLDVPLLA
jgi:hypothetical protein